MGANSGCCSGKEPKYESNLAAEAQTNAKTSYQTSSASVTPDFTEYVYEGAKEQIEAKTQKLKIYNAEPITARRSLELIDAETKNDENENEKLRLNSRKSRESYDISLDIEQLDGINNSKSVQTLKRRKKKIKNKLVCVLRECIDEFNKKMQSFSLIELMGTKSTNTVSSQLNQNELLDADLICKWFKHKKYDIEWFLICKRNKFIKVMVNKWSKISILTTIHLYDALQERIQENTPSVSISTLNLYKNSVIFCKYFMR